MLFILLGAQQAQAQAQNTADGRAVILEPLNLTNTRDLDFGNIVAPNAGTVVMVPNITATCTANGGLVHSGDCQPAEFGGAGQIGRFINIRLPPGREITLTGPGNDMLVAPATVQGSPDLQFWFRLGRNHIYRIVSSTGLFLFRVGGTLQVGNNQALGVYTGTFDVEVTYY